MKNEVRKKAKNILSKLSLEEKIGQLNQEPLWNGNEDEIKEKIRKGEIGSVILANSPTAGNDEQEKLKIALINEMERIAVEESSCKIPVIIGRDVIHGHNTVMPIPLALSASFNPEMVTDAYRCVAKEAAKDGIQWTFSPMIDISRDPRWGRCIEGIGEDPYLGENMARAMVKGFQGEDLSEKDSIAACAKHYIGYGAVEGGRDYGKSEISDYTLRNIYLRPFRAAVNEGVATVMNSFNEISGVLTTSSHYLLTELLKEELGFDGYVISDWATIEDLVNQGITEDKKQAAASALNAGLDMDMVSRCYIENLKDLVNEKKVSIETIDKAVLRILEIKIRLGLFENPYVDDTCTIDEYVHHAAAKRCSDESMVLLKNNNNILPLDKTSKIFAAGPMLFEKRAHWGSWTLDGDIRKVKSAAEVLKEKNVAVFMPSSEYLWDDYLKAVYTSGCDAVVVFLGESPRTTGEASSMSRIELPEEQLELIKKLHRLQKPIVGVLVSGRPMALEEAEPYLDAILYAWHSGTYAAESIIDILYGDVNPSGRLPMTFPRCTGQIPIYYNCSHGHGGAETYYQDAMQCAYNDRLPGPMYPFGYGKSYTEFEYSDIHCAENHISLKDICNGKKIMIDCNVKNTGNRDGMEVSQCYIRDKVSSMIRPTRELKGFSKNMIKANETIQLCFELGFEELAYYNASGKLCVEPGKFDIYVGKDCYAPYCLTIVVTE